MTRLVLVVLALLMPTALAMSVGDDSSGCAAEDTTGGVGGQDVGCKFHCESASQLSITVQAVDEDADVSGTASCGGVSAHCTGRQTCSDLKGWTDTAETGSCSASSNEAFDSGLYVTCASRPGGESDEIYCIPDVGCIPPSGGGGGGDEETPLPGIPIPACPAMVRLDPRALTQCVAQPSHSRAWLWVRAGEAMGEVCTDVCRPVVPTCVAVEGTQSCSIEFGPR